MKTILTSSNFSEIKLEGYAISGRNLVFAIGNLGDKHQNFHNLVIVDRRTGVIFSERAGIRGID